MRSVVKTNPALPTRLKALATRHQVSGGWFAAARMRAPWKYAAVLLWVPRPIRDLVYNVVAAIRMRIAGTSNACEIPPAEIRQRLIR